MVKTGYKHTEIGIIPQSWDVSILGHHATICRGGSPRPIQAYLTQAANGLNWIKIGDVRPDDKYITATREKIIPEGLSKTREVAEGDFLLSNSMSFGRPYILKIKGCIHDGWLTIQNYKHTFDTNFLYYYLSSDAVLWQYISMAAGSGVQNLNKEKVTAVTLAIPPISEQKRIATVLSDIDALIANLEKLIAKKKAIKQGAMQELLSGKRRLSGFDEKWDKVKLGECCSFLSGGTPSKANHEWWNGSIPWISSSDISVNDINRIVISRYISQEALEHSATKLCPAHSVLIVSRVGVGKVAVNSCELCTSQDFSTLVPKRHNAHYLAYFLLPVMKERANQTQGTSIKGITTDDIAEIEVFCPELAEQNDIAGVFLDMDRDIEELEHKLIKYRLIKKGMMSELLTGRIRLIDKEDA